jgi:hypothetical protein
MSRLDRWLRQPSVAPLSPPRGDTQPVETKGKIEDVALVAPVSRSGRRNKPIFTPFPRADDKVEPRPRATRATNPIPSCEISNFAVAPAGRQEGDKCCVLLDFETVHRGESPLTTAGSWRYACDSATEILTLTYSHNGEMLLWTTHQNDLGRLAELRRRPDGSLCQLRRL